MFFTSTESNLLLGILIDTIILAVAAVLDSIFYFDIFTPFRRGFFCDDESIKYPFHTSTVTDCMLYVISTALGLIAILLSELSQSSEEENAKSKQRFLFKWNIPYRVIIICTSTYVFVFGQIVTDALTNFIKYNIGRLRPNFLDVCQPDFNCTSNTNHYVEDYTCLNPDLYAVTDSRLSFPSGHASVVAYTMLFAMIYLNKRMVCNYGSLLKPVLQICMFIWASFTASSRIRDNKHHWSDVVGGTILGIAVCYATFCIRSNCSESPSSKDPEGDSESHVSLGIMKKMDFS